MSNGQQPKVYVCRVETGKTEGRGLASYEPLEVEAAEEARRRLDLDELPKQCEDKACPFHAGWFPGSSEEKMGILVLPLDTFSALNRGDGTLDRIKRMGKRAKEQWARLGDTASPSTIITLVSAENHYTVMVARTAIDGGRTNRTWEHWDCLQWRGAERNYHHPEKLRSTLAMLIDEVRKPVADKVQRAEGDAGQAGANPTEGKTKAGGLGAAEDNGDKVDRKGDKGGSGSGGSGNEGGGDKAGREGDGGGGGGGDGSGSGGIDVGDGGDGDGDEDKAGREGGGDGDGGGGGSGGSSGKGGNGSRRRRSHGGDISWAKAPITEMGCEQQSESALDCAVHAVTAIAHVMRGSTPNSDQAGKSKEEVDQKMKTTRRIVQEHYSVQMREFLESTRDKGATQRWNGPWRVEGGTPRQKGLTEIRCIG
jgi:hypothetical protein